MSDFVPVSKTKHADSGWLQPQNYRFAAQEIMVPVVMDEIGNVMMNQPLAFRRQKASSDKLRFELVALLSPVLNRNLFVKPDGSWLSGYIPAYLQAYPFRLLPAGDSGQNVLCFDQASGLMTESGAANSQAFFAENGDPSPAFAGVFKLLQQFELRRQQTQTAVDCLESLNLFTPWKIVLDTKQGKKQSVKGLSRINAAALQKVSAEALHKLHQCGALPIIYAQLLSEQRAQTFGELLSVQGELHKKSSESVTMGNIEAVLGGKSDMINLDNF